MKTLLKQRFVKKLTAAVTVISFMMNAGPVALAASTQVLGEPQIQDQQVKKVDDNNPLPLAPAKPAVSLAQTSTSFLGDTLSISKSTSETIQDAVVLDTKAKTSVALNLNPGSAAVKSAAINPAVALPPPTNAEIRTQLETVIRDNAVNFITAQTPAGQKKIGYFDLNGDGFVTVSDELMARNILTLETAKFTVALDKLMKAVREKADNRFDLNGDGSVKWDEYLTIRAALTEGRNVPLSSAEIRWMMELVIRDNPVNFLTAQTAEGQKKAGYFDLNGDKFVTVTDELMARNILTLEPSKFTVALEKLMKAVREKADNRFDLNGDGSVKWDEYLTIRAALTEGRNVPLSSSEIRWMMALVIRDNPVNFLTAQTAEGQKKAGYFDLNGDKFVTVTDELMARNILTLEPAKFTVALEKLMKAVREKADNRFDLNGDGSVKWDEYLTIRAALTEGRNVPLSSAEIRWMMELVIRDNPVNFLTAQTAEGQKKAGYFDLNGDKFVTVTDELMARNILTLEPAKFTVALEKLMKAVREKADNRFDLNGDGSVKWDEYMTIRAALTEGRNVPLSSAEIRWMMELVIRDNPVNFLTAQTPEGQKRAGYFDLNGDGFVTVSDELMARNILTLEPAKFTVALEKLMKAVREKADNRFDLNGDGSVKWDEYLTIRAALTEGRNVPLSSSEIRWMMALVIRDNPVNFLTAQTAEGQKKAGYFDLNGDKFVTVTDELMARNILTLEPAKFTVALDKLMKAVREKADNRFDLNGDGSVKWDEYLTIRAALTEGRNVPLSSSEIRWMMELVIRDNAVNFLTAQTPEGQRKIGYFDLNGDGFVTVSDELMVRNIAGSSSEVFDAVIAKLMRAVLEGADQRLDINGDVNFDQMDVNLLFAALSDGRS